MTTRRYTVREVVYAGLDGTGTERQLAWLIYLSPIAGEPGELYVLRLAGRAGDLPTQYTRGAEVTLDARLLTAQPPEPRDGQGTPEGVE